MKVLVHKISVHPKYSRLYNWSKLITITGGAQAIVQAAGLACGILIVRLLPTQEYAFYTLANTLLGTMTVLADGGISAGVMAQGGQVWNDKAKLGAVISTGLDLRKRFAICSLLIATPILMYLLITHGASWLTTILIILSLIPAFFAALSDSLLEIVPKLHQEITLLQKNQITVSLGRLFLSALLMFIFPFSALAILASGIPRVYGNIRLRKFAKQFTETNQAADPEVRKSILKVVRRIMPSSIYYCFVSQISIWLISIFGTTTSIAQIGALGRISMVMNFFTVLISTLIVPRFAKLQQGRKIILTRFFQILFLVAIVSLVIMSLIYFFPKQILIVLGGQYSNLEYELFLAGVMNCLGLFIGTIHSLSISRAYILSPVINIGVHVLSQIILILSLHLNTTRNILVFSILDYTVIALMFVANFLYHAYKLPAKQ